MSMKYLLSSLAVAAPSAAFTSIGIYHRANTGPLESTLSPVNDKFSSQEGDDDEGAKFGAISMQLDELGENLGGAGRARLVWDCYNLGIEPVDFHGDQIKLGSDDFETIFELLPSKRRTNSLGKGALDKLAALYPKNTGGRLEGGVASLSDIKRSYDGTTKLLLRLADGYEIETVIIPWEGVRSTVCISSQVGCKQGCAFCATGRMKARRNLTSDEILAQMFWARKICRLKDLPEVSNVVFMGLGEPSDNAENVIRAAEILTTRGLFQLSATKVTVSTVAPTPDSFRQFANVPCVLAWSVHSANDNLRKRLVPTTRYSMAELRQGLIDTMKRRPLNMRTTMLEYVLLGGVNDSLEQADELAEFAKVIVDEVPGCKLVINLIPYNDTGDNVFKKPRKDSSMAFQKRLQYEHGLYSFVRVTRGDDESAACGQLATMSRASSESRGLKP